MSLFRFILPMKRPRNGSTTEILCYCEMLVATGSRHLSRSEQNLPTFRVSRYTAASYDPCSIRVADSTFHKYLVE
jgi:hypothetical protein